MATGSVTSSCMNFSSPATGNFGNISVLNNIMTNTSGGYAIYIDANAVTLNYVSLCNYNDLYVNGSNLGRYGVPNISTLSAWQSTTGKDANSISILPDYFSATDLHLKSYIPFRVFNPLIDVTTDIDGETRSTVKPVTGADESPCFPVNAGIRGIVSPGKVSCDGVLPVTGTLYNLGTTRLDSVYIDYYLNGIKKKSILYKTPLLYLASAAVQVDVDTFYSGKNYSVTIKTRMPNGLIDPYPFDDGDSVIYIRLYKSPVITSISNDTVCVNRKATLKVTTTNADHIYWTDSITGNLVSEDSIFVTPNLYASKTYLVQAGIGGNPDMLTTTKSISGNEMGNMFNIKAINTNVMIDSFAIHTSAPVGTHVPVELYYIKGTYKGFETNSGLWTHVGTDTVYSNGTGKFTDVILGHIKIIKGDSIGVYITSTEAVSTLNYFDGANIYKDANIKVTTGTKNFYPFDPFYQTNKSWDGIVYYSSGSGCLTAGIPVIAFVTIIPYINLGHDTTLKENQSITLDAGAGYDSYLWSTGIATRKITVDTTGIGIHSKAFSVKVTKDSCIGYSDTIIITFIKISTGITPQNNLVTRIYPNPSGDELNVEISGIDKNVTISFTDMQGKEALTIQFVPINGIVKEKIDISGLPSGVYFMKITNEKIVRIEKVMKK